MSCKLLCILLGVGMGWASTAGVAATSDGPSLKDEPKPPYTENRWIGLRNEALAGCPPVPGWNAVSLLDLARARGAVPGESQEGELYKARAGDEPRTESGKKSVDDKLLDKLGLNRFCVYTTEDPQKPFPQPLPAGLVKGERDRMALSAAATHHPPMGAIGDQAWQTLADHFVSQVGRVRLAPTEAPSVRLVFVDTHPTDRVFEKPQPGRPWHGYSMAHLARQLACGEGESRPCAIQVATRLALRHDHFDPNMPFLPPGSAVDAGGHLGLVGDLAEAILAEVDSWRNADPDKKTKLVLNLSVGWDGELGKLSDLDVRKVSKLELSVLAVYKALRYASHHGVLVIAAAGNRRGGRPETQWPVLPAAWELRRPSCLPFALGRKPVYAVGGVDWQGLPLPNSRFGGRPRRVAYSDHAVAKTGEPEANESTMIYTGSSVSAAVVSSIAAVVWHLRPELRPAQVMRLIARSGQVLDSRADFYAWKPLFPPPHLRRVSLCQAVLATCGPDGRRCPALGLIDCQLGKHPPAKLSAVHSLERRPQAYQTPNALRPPCEPRTRHYAALAAESTRDAADLCPMELLPDLNVPGLVYSQPPDNPCPTCTIVPDPPLSSSLSLASTAQGYALLVYIDPNWFNPAVSGTINSAVLVINCGPESELPRSYDISVPTAGNSARLIIGPIDGRESLAGCTASVDFRVTVEGEDRSVQSPVYVDP